MKSGYGQDWRPETLVAELRRTTPRIGLWLNTTAQTSALTAQSPTRGWPRLWSQSLGHSASSEDELATPPHESP